MTNPYEVDNADGYHDDADPPSPCCRCSHPLGEKAYPMGGAHFMCEDCWDVIHSERLTCGCTREFYQLDGGRVGSELVCATCFNDFHANRDAMVNELMRAHRMDENRDDFMNEVRR
jgi:hypothetical protein